MDSIFEGRQEHRYPFSKPIEITWTDATGDERHGAGTTINVSMYGALVEVPEAIPLLRQVSIQIEGKEISSKGCVRHCQKASSWFRVGIRFERTLLAEHMPSLDAVLIQSLRCASVSAAPIQVPRSRSWCRLLQPVARLMHLEPSSAAV